MNTLKPSMNTLMTVGRLVVLAVGGLLGFTASAVVINVATDGNDATGDGSASAPFATVACALAAASDGDTVQVADGTYGECGISVTKAVTIRGNASDRTLVTFDAQRMGRVFVVNNPDAVLADLSVANGYVTSSGSVTLDGHTALGVGGANLILTQGMATNCVFAGGEANFNSALGGNVFVMRGLVVGCRLDGGRTLGYGANAYMYGGRISRCEIVNGIVCPEGQNVYTCGSAAVHAWAEMSDAIVDNCLIASNKCLSTSGNGEKFPSTIYVGGTGSGRMVVANCTIVDNLGSSAAWQHCMRVKEDANRLPPLVINTVLFNNGGTEETEWYGALSTLSLIHNCAATIAMVESENYVVLSTDVTQTFMSATDFHPSVDSPLIGAGVVGEYAQYVGDVDINGRLRFKDGGVTLGCYEMAYANLRILKPSPGQFVSVGEVLGFVVEALDKSGQQLFRWTFGDGSNPVETSEPTVSHIYSNVGFYAPSVSCSTDGGETWSKAVSVKDGIRVVNGFLDQIHVSPTGDDSGDGTLQNPLKTIRAGIDMAVAGADRKTVFVHAGTYAEHGLEVLSDITIRGEGRDKTIIDGESLERVFVVDSPSAVLADMTIRNGKTITTTSCKKDGITASGVAGANVCLVDGMVTNCVLKDGYACMDGGYACGGNIFVFKGTVVDSRLDGGQCDGFGANAYMYGGRISRCEIVNGIICPSGKSLLLAGSAAVHAWADASDAIVDNCLIVSNKCRSTAAANSGSYGGICDVCGTDNHAMFLVNCTIADNLGSTPNWEPCIRVITTPNRKQPKLINCLLFNNGGTAQLEWGDNRSNLSCFYNCASTIEIPGGENCTVVPTDAAEVFSLGQARPFEPASGSALRGNGSVADYLEYAEATKDVYGKKRFSRGSIDIGCAERYETGLAIIFQ